jgi:hypothetical protein
VRDHLGGELVNGVRERQTEARTRELGEQVGSVPGDGPDFRDRRSLANREGATQGNTTCGHAAQFGEDQPVLGQVAAGAAALWTHSTRLERAFEPAKLAGRRPFSGRLSLE